MISAVARLPQQNLGRANLALGESREVIGDLLRITHWRNTGAAFGILRELLLTSRS
jgi:lipoprotein signal peptidase